MQDLITEPLINVVFTFVITDRGSSYKQYLARSVKLNARDDDPSSQLVTAGYDYAARFFGHSGVKDGSRFLFNHGSVAVQYCGHRVVEDDDVFTAISQILSD